MSYKFTKGSQIIGDLKAADDTQRDTKIDFGEDYIGLETSGSVRMVISGSDGKVGIGVASPSHKFDVNGDIRVRGNDIRDNSGNPAVTFDGSANTTVVNDLTVGGTFSHTPQVMKVGMGANLTLTAGGTFQELQFNNMSFDTFVTGGWDSTNYKFVAGEEGYYDISATIVFDDLHEGSTGAQYQIWLLSDSDHATYSSAFNFDYIALANHAPTPADTDMATVNVNTIAHLSASQSASIQVRQTGTATSSKVLSGKNRTFMCVKKL